ncbi:hypothetical protein [Sphingobacterium siyangense]|uniref:hypothetical protein n=1 Tax=Sphingobacterium siyangense TaxID=459529 RepID=UPI002FDCA0F9
MTKFTFFLYLAGMLDLSGFAREGVVAEPGWYFYSGKIEMSPVTLSMYVDHKNITKGNLCFVRNADEHIAFTGKKVGDSFILYTKTSNVRFKNTKLTFTHKNPHSNNTIKNATIENEGRSKLMELTFDGFDPNSYKRKYQLDKSNEEVELFFYNIKNSINDDNKYELAKLIEFPISVHVKNRNMEMSNAQEFVRNYTAVFNPGFKRKIQQACTCDLRANAQGVMLGEGIIWVAEDRKGKLKIIAINN